MVAVHSVPNDPRASWAALVRQGRELAGALRSSAGKCNASNIAPRSGMGMLYSMSPRQLVACGYVVDPLVSVTRENIDNWVITNYNYNVGEGSINTVYYPPRSFKALTAPNAVLEALGIPPRPPIGASTYGNWVDQYGSETGASWVKPTPFLVSLPCAHTSGPIAVPVKNSRPARTCPNP